MSTYARFDEYPKHGEGLTIYEPDPDLYGRGVYAPGTELIFHVGNEGAHMARDDIERLVAVLSEHLARPTFDHDSVQLAADESAGHDTP